VTAVTSKGWPAFTLAERDRRWRLTQELMEGNELDALIVYGERDTVGQPLYAPDAWLTNDRPGNAVIVPRGEDPYVMVNLHIAVGQHMEGVRRGDQMWIPPERMYAGSERERPGAGRGSGAILAFLREKGLDRGRIGVVGLEPFGASFPEGVMPYGTYAGVIEGCPAATFVPMGQAWHAMTLARSEEELAMIAFSADAGEAMCAAMIEATRPGVGEHELYAAAMRACFEAGATQHWMIIVTATDGESVAWGPPPWTYRPQQPQIVREGDVVMAELFPVYGMMESQQQLAIAVGAVHPDVPRAGEVARQAYDAGLAACVAGNTFGELADAMQAPVDAAGGWTLTPHIHTMNPMVMVGGCGLSEELPDVGAYGNLGGLTTRGREIELRPGMSFAFEPNCVLGRRRVNIGGTVVIGGDGRPRELNTLANELQRV
jgi:Xaa-Pro aminopeptidase